MRTLKHEMLISACPEKVFDLISRIEDFPRYSTYIKEVRALGENRFLWRINIFGIQLEWEAEVTESSRPATLAWRSTSGIYNTGRYTLTPVGEKSTLVSFTMEYRLKNSAAERVIATLIEPVLDTLFKKSLDKVKKKLEG